MPVETLNPAGDASTSCPSDVRGEFADGESSGSTSKDEKLLDRLRKVFRGGFELLGDSGLGILCLVGLWVWLPPKILAWGPTLASDLT